MLGNSGTSLSRSPRMTPLVLVVDDDLDNVILIGHVLNILNLKYLVATDAKNALDLAMDKKPDFNFARCGDARGGWYYHNPSTQSEPAN